jgi:hypothetical protein
MPAKKPDHQCKLLQSDRLTGFSQQPVELASRNLFIVCVTLNFWNFRRIVFFAHQIDRLHFNLIIGQYGLVPEVPFFSSGLS